MTSEERMQFVKDQIEKAQQAVWNGHETADETRLDTTRAIVARWEQDMVEVSGGSPTTGKRQ